MNKTNIRKLVVCGMLAAMAYIIMVVLRIPMAPAPFDFLKFDPKDIVLAIGGFLYGPLTAGLMSLVVAFVEMLTVSTTGWIGFVMNTLSSCAFACTAALIYKQHRTAHGALIGLLSGVFAMTGTMLLWNYFISPLYMGVDRAFIAGALVPVFLPFNMLKSGINAALTILLYKPLTKALRLAHLIETPETHINKKTTIYVYAIGAAALAGLILLALWFCGVL